MQYCTRHHSVLCEKKLWNALKYLCSLILLFLWALRCAVQVCTPITLSFTTPKVSFPAPFFFISRVSYIRSCFHLHSHSSSADYSTTSLRPSSPPHTPTHTHTHTHTLMGCRLIHHISIRSIGNNCRDLYKTQLLLSPSMLHYFIIWPCVGHAHTEGERETSSKHLHLPTYMTPSLVLRAASSTPALVFSAAATTPSLAMENPFIRASILDVEFDNDALQTDWAWQNLQGLKVSVYMLKFSDDRREEYREILCRDKWMHGHSERRAVEWERERERAASRRKRTGCRETEPAGCCSAFKSCCGYSPHPHVLHTHTRTQVRTHARTHTHTRTHSRHALTLTAMSNRLIIYLLRSSQQCIKTRCFLQLLQFSCTLGTCILPRSLVDYFFIFGN